MREFRSYSQLKKGIEICRNKSRSRSVLKNANVLVEATADALETIFNKLEPFMPILIETNEKNEQKSVPQRERCIDEDEVLQKMLK